MNRRKFYNSKYFSNTGYKLLSFILALSVWVVLLSKKDSVLVRELNVVFLTEKSLSVVKASSKKIKIKLKGPRFSLLKLRSISEPYSIDVKQLEKGVHQVLVPGDGLTLPVGVSISEVTPDKLWIRVEDPVTTKEALE